MATSTSISSECGGVGNGPPVQVLAILGNVFDPGVDVLCWLEVGMVSQVVGNMAVSGTTPSFKADNGMMVFGTIGVELLTNSDEDWIPMGEGVLEEELEFSIIGLATRPGDTDMAAVELEIRYLCHASCVV